MIIITCINIVLFLFSLFILAYCFFKNKIMNITINTFIEYEHKLRNNVQEMHEKTNDIIQEKDKLINVLYTINLCAYLIINLLSNNHERYSFYYQKLFFMGVPKNILNDINEINKFLDDLSNNKYIIEQGEKPYKYKYIKKENKNEYIK